MTTQTFDDWCANIPGLSRVAPGMWSGSDDRRVSFPDDGHADLEVIEEQSYWFAHRNAVITTVVSRFTQMGRILDIGGGNGFVSVALQRAGLESIVIEPGPTGAAVASRRGLPVIRAAFQDLDLPDGSVHAAGMFDVLEHIEDANGALKRLHRVIAPGGMVYIAVPAHSFLWSAQDDFGGHFRRYTVRRLQSDLGAAGFEPLYGTYFFAALVPAVFAFRTLPSLFGKRRGDDRERSAEEHRLPPTIAGRLVARSLAWERDVISRNGIVPTGTSCLVAARRD